MKKIFAALLCFLLLCNFISCNQSDPAQTTESTTEPTVGAPNEEGTTPSVTASDVTTPTPQETTQPVSTPDAVFNPSAIAMFSQRKNSKLGNPICSILSQT